MRDSNPPLKHEENGTSDQCPQFVAPVVDLDDEHTTELLAFWSLLDADERIDLLTIARDMSSRQR
jgi:hypothetical protein